MAKIDIYFEYVIQHGKVLLVCKLEDRWKKGKSLLEFAFDEEQVDVWKQEMQQIKAGKAVEIERSRIPLRVRFIDFLTSIFGRSQITEEKEKKPDDKPKKPSGLLDIAGRPIK